MNDEFIYITPLSVFGTVFVGTGALVSNTLRVYHVAYMHSCEPCDLTHLV